MFFLNLTMGNKPTHNVKHYSNGNKQYEEWYQNNRYHRLDGPARIYYYDNGNKQYEAWHQNGILHRLDGPVEVRYCGNGNKRYEAWRQNGILHRLDGPAFIRYNEDGSKNSEYWYQNGKLHRPINKGPAVVDYQNGHLLYYLDSCYLTKQLLDVYIKSELNLYFDDVNLIPIVINYTLSLNAI